MLRRVRLALSPQHLGGGLHISLQLATVVLLFEGPNRLIEQIIHLLQCLATRFGEQKIYMDDGAATESPKYEECLFYN